MLKSLYSGVSGLQSHQVAMDIESNNIANVNTTGYKYARANFSDLLAQTSSIATAPQGALGGKNAVQIGLGSTVSSMTRIFSQGSIQNSDKNTDVAIQGDGFFVISPDGGNTYKYTRAGDFKFDANGNFVDNNGFVTQGWLRDKVTGKVDSSAPITNINIAPGLTTPASPTAEIVIKANLSSGPTVKSFSPAYTIASTPPPKDGLISPDPSAIDAEGNNVASDGMGVMYNDNGEAYSLQKNQGIWASFTASTYTGTSAVPAGAGVKLDIGFTLDDGSVETVTATSEATTPLPTDVQNAQMMASAINAKTYITGVTASVRTNATGSYLDLSNDNSRETASHNIHITRTAAQAVADNSGTFAAATGVAGATIDAVTAYKYQYDPSAVLTTAGADKKFGTMKDLREALEVQARSVGDHDPVSTVDGIAIANATAAPLSESITIGGTIIPVTVPIGTANDTATAYMTAINSAGIPGVTASVSVTDQIVLTNTNSAAIAVDPALATSSNFTLISLAAGGDGTPNENNIAVTVNTRGAFEITNLGGSEDGDYDINLRITGIRDVAAEIKVNSQFSSTMQALNSVLPAGSAGKAISQGFNAPTHSSSIDIFDSLGSKHTVRTEFRKIAVEDTSSSWALKISVPTPNEIDTVYPYNEKNDVIKFNSDGSLLSPAVFDFSFTANNGSTQNQQVSINFGTANGFDGMTSFDSPSSTSGISQDGFTGGDLVGIRIDQSGTIVGSFSNGRSFGLAQIAMAKFTNNEGLATEGGNVYIQTANSGDPVIGSAATSGRGFIQSSALEASNVDLSRALTQLIIIQRGYQANGKTITTSDQLLQTLIGLKN